MFLLLVYMQKEGMRDYCEASANFIDEIFLPKENSDQIISTKLDLTDAREATNFLSQAIL